MDEFLTLLPANFDADILSKLQMSRYNAVGTPEKAQISNEQIDDNFASTEKKILRGVPTYLLLHSDSLDWGKLFLSMFTHCQSCAKQISHTQNFSNKSSAKSQIPIKSQF